MTIAFEGNQGVASVVNLAAVPAAGVDLVAQQATDFDIAAGFTQPTTPRSARVVFSAAWDGGSVEVTGTDARGSRHTEVLVAVAGGGTREGSVPYAVVTRVRNLGTRTAGTVDIRTSTRLGLPLAPAAVFKSTVDGANEAVGAVVAGYGTIEPTTIPNGAHSYVFWVR